MWDLVPQPGIKAWICIGSVESQPLDHQGSPWIVYYCWTVYFSHHFCHFLFYIFGTLLLVAYNFYFFIVFSFFLIFLISSWWVGPFIIISSVQLLSRVRLFATPWITVRQASLSITNSQVHSNSRPSSRWCHPAISSSVALFSSCPQSLPASESFPMSQLFAWGGQSTGVSALVSFLACKCLQEYSLRSILSDI